MPNLNVPFAGQTLIIPAAYYADNVSNVGGPLVPTTPPLILIGFGYGGVPFVPATYDSPQALTAAIRGGPVSAFVPFLTTPSTQLNGAQQVTLINVGRNTQSSLSLTALSGVSGVINLKSVNYGLPSNLLQIEVDDGVLAGRTIRLFDGFSNASLTGSNLGVPFQLSYLGASSGVSYSVVVSGGIATAFNVTSPVPGESVHILLNPANYGTIQQVIEYLNGTGNFTANILSNGNLPASSLDSASAIALATGTPGNLSFQQVTATLGDIAYWFNQQAFQLATATIPNGVVSSPALLPDLTSLTPFSGATSVPPTLSDYASGYNVALTIPGWTVFADDNSSGVVALGVQHVITASQTVNGRWRRFFTGSDIGDSIDDAIQGARDCDAINVTYVYPGIFRTDTATGVNTLYSGLFAAAAAAGMATGNAVATPLTNKALFANGVEISLDVSEIDLLQQNGVMPIALPQNTNIPTIVSDLTTWQLDSNPENVFNQQVACRYYLAYSVINTLQPYVGTIADPLNEVRILNAAKSVLNALLYNSGNANAVLVAWDPKTLILRYTGSNQVAAITVSVVFVGQNRFITCTVNVQPLNITISATG